MGWTDGARRVADAVLEAAIVPSFTRVGPALRRPMFGWDDSRPDQSGRVVLITGATTGIGRSTAEELARRGARVVVIGRDEQRTSAAVEDLRAASGNDTVSHLLADLADLDGVRAVAEEFRRSHDRLDVVIHNAGALLDRHTVGPSGIEVTVAAQVVGPFLLTGLLLEPLVAAGPGRVLTMSSGGMYSQPLTVGALEMAPDDYRGSVQYARAKRAQVTLTEMWPDELAAAGIERGRVVFHTMHPGWVDTPGVRASLPGFARIVGPLLRTPEQGADTMVWLATDDDEPLRTNGGFWLDRRQRPIHKLPATRRSDTPERRRRLWGWCVERSGWEPAAPRTTV